jgi:hypothetical protein
MKAQKSDSSMKPRDSSHFNRAKKVGFGFVLIPALVLIPHHLFAADEKRFDSPQAAVDALKAAVEVRDTNELHAIFGPTAHGMVSADVVEAAEERELFVRRFKEKVNPVQESDSKVVLQVGADGWAFPIPLVKEGGQWFFDTEAGKEEVLNRRIGENELGAIGVCRAYVLAQREYASEDRTGDEVLEYAQHLRSTPGKHDGLYWSAKTGDQLSPLGPLVARARIEGYHKATSILKEEQSPYHGYYFKILTRQGKHAPAGKYDYIINGHMIAGFGLVAWPAEWGNTGVMTFVVNQRGKVYQKNLGEKTATIAAGMEAYDPDDSWTVTKDQ